MDITPVPDDAEAAAIAAALAALLAAQGADDADAAPADPRWRFSGRWWNRPTALVRQRP